MSIWQSRKPAASRSDSYRVSREEVDIRVNINKADSSPTSEWNVVRYVTRSSQINCVLRKRQNIVPELQPQRKGNDLFFRKKKYFEEDNRLRKIATYQSAVLGLRFEFWSIERSARNIEDFCR